MRKSDGFEKIPQLARSKISHWVAH